MATQRFSIAPPSPPPAHFLSRFGSFLRFLRDPAGEMIRLHRAYGEVASLVPGTNRYVFAFGPKNNQRVLGDPVLFRALDAGSMPLRIPQMSALARLYAGLHQMNGERHERQRRLMLPAFHRNQVVAWHEAVVVLVDQKLSSWRVGQRLDLLQAMRELALAIAIRSRLGLDPDREGKVISTLLQHWLGLVFSPLVVLLPFNIPLMPYRKLLGVSGHLDAGIRDMIDRKRGCDQMSGDVLSTLIRVQDEDGTRLTDEELIGQITTLFVAGHDITARALTWTLFLLAQHPRTLGDLLDELTGRLGGRAPSAEQLDGLTLLDRVVRESLRLLPPVLWWARVSAGSFELGRYALPAGTYVMISHFVTHRLPELYDQPSRFLPERWATAHPGPYEYIPFSSGPRMCPGMAAAMMEMKIVLAILLPRYRLALPADVRIDCGGPMLSAPRRGLPVMVHHQDRLLRRERVEGNICDLVDLN